MDSLTAGGGAIWSPKGGNFERIAAENFDSLGYDSSEHQKAAVDRMLSATLQTKQPVVLPASPPEGSPPNAPNFLAAPIFNLPILVGEKPALVLQIWLKEPGDPATYNDIAVFLNGWATNAGAFLRNHQGNIAVGRNEELAALVRMQAALLGELDPKVAASALVNFGADLLKADLACLFRRKGKGWLLIAASNQEVVDTKGQQAIRLSALAKALPNADEKSQTASQGSIENLDPLLQATDFHSLVWRHFHPKNKPSDHLLVAFRHDGQPFNEASVDLMDRIREAAGKSLETAHHFDAIPLRPVVSASASVINNWRASRRAKLVAALVVTAAIVAALTLIPVPLKIAAECVVEPRTLTAAVAESEGKIVEVLAKEGQKVTAGQPVAKLEDDDYVTQLAVAKQQQLRWQVEASRAQSTGDEAERKLAEINAQRESEAIKRLEYLRSKTTIVSPANGTILSKNLHNREGEHLTKGAVFCEVAGEDHYDLVLHVKQNDIGDLLRAIGEKGSLPATFILHSHTQHELACEIVGLDTISQLPEITKDQSVFFVRIDFPKDSPIREFLKPGYTGKAKVRLGESNLLYAWFRPFLNYWRVEWTT